MAQFVRDTGDDLTPIQHEMKLFHEHLKLFSLKGAMGKKGSGSMIIVDTTLKAQPGDTKRYHFVPHAFANDEEDAILGQDTEILGNEKNLEEFFFDLVIDEVNYALRKKGKMTDQRTVFNIAQEHERQIVSAFGQHNENVIFRALTGIALTELKADFTAATDTTDRVNGAGRIIRADGPNGSKEILATDSANVDIVTGGTEAVAVGDKLSPKLIEDAVIMAIESGKFKMVPLRVGPNNEEFFMLYVSLRAGRDLRQNPDWVNHALSAMEAGIAGDMIAQGALGVWDNVIVKSSERIVAVTDGTDKVARNLLVGRDAAVLGWAQTMNFSEELIDHKRILSSNGSEIRGEAKTQFDGVDYAVAQLITASN